MTAQEIYDSLKVYGNSVETTICHLHKPTAKIPCCLNPIFKCDNSSHTKVVDFDCITSNYCKSQGIKTYSSADALSYKDKYLLFIEIKGWRQFIKNELHDKYDKTKIENKELSYNLDKKLNESIIVCQQIISPDTIVADENIIYILVIDTDIKKQDAQTQLLYNLNTLATSSSSIYVAINNITETHLQHSVKQSVRKIRTFCQNLDNIYSNI